jgi:hypothetical protein
MSLAATVTRAAGAAFSAQAIPLIAINLTLERPLFADIDKPHILKGTWQAVQEKS